MSDEHGVGLRRGEGRDRSFVRQQRRRLLLDGSTGHVGIEEQRPAGRLELPSGDAEMREGRVARCCQCAVRVGNTGRPRARTRREDRQPRSDRRRLERVIDIGAHRTPAMPSLFTRVALRYRRLTTTPFASCTSDGVSAEGSSSNTATSGHVAPARNPGSECPRPAFHVELRAIADAMEAAKVRMTRELAQEGRRARHVHLPCMGVAESTSGAPACAISTAVFGKCVRTRARSGDVDQRRRQQRRERRRAWASILSTAALDAIAPGLDSTLVSQEGCVRPSRCCRQEYVPTLAGTPSRIATSALGFAVLASVVRLANAAPAEAPPEHVARFAFVLRQPAVAIDEMWRRRCGEAGGREAPRSRGLHRRGHGRRLGRRSRSSASRRRAGRPTSSSAIGQEAGSGTAKSRSTPTSARRASTPSRSSSRS